MINGLSEAIHDPSQIQYVSSNQLCKRFNKTSRTLLRWQTSMNFPKPAISYPGGENLWDIADVIKWEKEFRSQGTVQQ